MNDPTDSNSSTDTADDAGSDVLEARLDNDELFRSLADQRRRYVLHHVFEEGVGSLRELARRLAAFESGIAVDAVSDEEIAPRYTSLHQAHVPVLADLGIVEFHRGEEAITAGPKAEHTRDVLEYARTPADEDLARHARMPVPS